MATDAGMAGKSDLTEHLIFATGQGAVLVTCDRPFAGRAAQRSDHAGVICWTGILNDIGGMVTTLTEFGETYSHEQAAGRVFWLK